MNKKILIGLLISLITNVNLFSQEKPIELKTIKNAYEKIIHFTPEDYDAPTKAPEDGRPIMGIQGLFAGDNYLIVWTEHNFHVFDINSYKKITVVDAELAIKDVIEHQGKIHVLTYGDCIYIYNTFSDFDSYRFLSSWKNLAEYKTCTSESNIKKYQEEAKIIPTDKENRKILRKQVYPWRSTQVASLHSSQGQLYLSIDNTYFNFNEDLIKEIEGGKKYLFPIEEIKVGKRDWYLFDGKCVLAKRKFVNNCTLLNVLHKDFNSEIIKSTKYVIRNSNKEELRANLPIAYVNNWLYLLCSWKYRGNNTYRGKSVLALNIDNKKVINFEMPFGIFGLPVYTNYLKYYSFSNSVIYGIFYNEDFSFDIVKLEVQ